ncbi:MAG: hypothetical protein LC124_07285 [Ignavibacteriales bacterium]|nr:hypothetical protein [Ignavibacteriales bacterium]MDX9712493.1 hypothetical protein [Ignavibacteriaceae bacterium]
MRFDEIEKDSAVISSYEFLIMVSHAFQKPDPVGFLIESGLLKDQTLSPIRIGRALKEYVSPNIKSSEYAAIAEAAAIDSFNYWFQQNASNETSLFGEGHSNLDFLKKLGTGSGFCELSRLYFAKFTERYLKYFLEREASSQFTTLSERERFNSEISSHLDKVSKHAFETSKITQSFAAGWFNKNVKESLPSRKKIESFLNIAFGKMKGELLREEN